GRCAGGRQTSGKVMDRATMRSDVIGDFQEPYPAVLVDGDDMQRCSKRHRKAARTQWRPAVAPNTGTARTRLHINWTPRINRQVFRRTPSQQRATLPTDSKCARLV